MFCTNCGQQIDDRAVLCVHCGVPVGSTTNYCKACANQLYPGAQVCNKCGVPVYRVAPAGAKSKIAGGLLGIFLGGLGIHNFYLGYTGKAIAQVLMGTVGWITFGIVPFAAWVWGLVEGIMILTGSINKDGQGNLLRD